MTDLITDLYRQNEWANLETLRICRDLTDEQLDSTAVGSYGSIRATLQHIVGAETGYAFRLGNTTTTRIRGDEPWHGFDTLEASVRGVVATFIAAATDPGKVIRVGSDDEPYEVEASVILTQVLNHSTEHRSQVFSMLTGLGIEPPELSGWEWGLAVGKMHSV
ncbi:MAG TPA: DinB family protein [Acidimicrobiia bacterium]|nr:DinB family protein [Acidimicrobiia bacterium]